MLLPSSLVKSHGYFIGETCQLCCLCTQSRWVRITTIIRNTDIQLYWNSNFLPCISVAELSQVVSPSLSHRHTHRWCHPCSGPHQLPCQCRGPRYVSWYSYATIRGTHQSCASHAVIDQWYITFAYASSPRCARGASQPNSSPCTYSIDCTCNEHFS
jgi:hypothetical protein